MFTMIESNSLFNLVFDSALSFGMGSSDAEHQSYLTEALMKNEIAVEVKSYVSITERSITKKQRYAILRGLFRNEEISSDQKDRLL